MELEHSFTVPVPRERAWDVLLDVERVAPCMPGATLDSVDGDEIRGRIKVKVGPISMTYAGTAKIVERDEAAGVVRLDASGKETRGAGTASASVRSVLEDRGHETRVTVLTTLNVTGKPAQFGRGVMNEVGGKLLNIFATNLATLLGQLDEPAEATPALADAPAPASASETSLDDLHLPARAVASLNRDGITTITQLAGKTEHDLLAIDGIGPASVDDIKARLAEHGLTLDAEALSGVSASPAAPSPTSAGSGSGPSGASSAAANGAAPSMTAKSAGNGSRTGATTGPPGKADEQSAAHIEADSLNLIKVAGVPVLKRSLPVIAGVSVVLFFGLRRKMRRRSK